MTENLVSDIGIELTMAFVTCAARSSDSSPQSNFLKFLKTAIEETLTIEANWLSLEHNFNGWSTHRIGNLKANRCIDRDGRESFVVEILPAVSNRLCHGYGTKPAVSQTDLRNKNSPPLSHPNPKVICPLIQTSSSVTHDLIYHLRFKIWHVYWEWLERIPIYPLNFGPFQSVLVHHDVYLHTFGTFITNLKL